MKPLPLKFQKLQKSLIDKSSLEVSSKHKKNLSASRRADRFFLLLPVLTKSTSYDQGKMFGGFKWNKKIFPSAISFHFSTSPISFVNFFIFLLTNSDKSIRMMSIKKYKPLRKRSKPDWYMTESRAQVEAQYETAG